MRLSNIQQESDRNHGVEHEINNFEISINGRVWKILPGKGPDGSPEQIRAENKIDTMCKNKTATSGKSWSWKLTSAAPTITEKQINMPARFSPGDEVRVKNHPELQGVLVKLLSNNAALVNFEISDDHEPVESEVDVIDLEPATLHEQDVEEKLDANQRRAGQAGPTDRAPLRGKLVGGDAMEENVYEGDVFFIEMGSTLIETTVVRANHDTILLAADDTAMSLLEASNIMEAEYHGHKVQLGKPMQGDVKKFKVYVKDPKTGNVKKVNFGDPNMRIKKSNPARRRSFRARHHCENPGPRTKARYWSCRKW